MNKNQTIEKMKGMRLIAMAGMYQHHLQNNLFNDSTPDEYISLLTDHEWEDRQNKKIQRLLKQAAFRQKATIVDIDYTSARNLDKNMFARLSSLDFITKKENLILTGASGVGKSYLAQALGHQACLMGLKTQYFITARLFNRLKLAKVDGTYNKELKKLMKLDLLILDDFGLTPLDKKQQMDLMEIMEDRHAKSSTIIASQLPVSNWYDVIGEATIADAILDRLVHTSHRIELKGKSLRKKL